MQTLLMAWLLAAQLDKPPEFSRAPGFQKSQLDVAIDSAAHTSGQKSESAKWMVKSLAQWPRSLADAENASWQGAMALLGRGALADAAAAFAKGTREFPAHVRQHAGYAAVVYAQGQYERAAAILVAAAQRHPKEVRLAPYLVDVLDADARVRPVLKAWAEAFPQNAEAQWAYGVALMESAPALAEKRWQEAVKLSRGGDGRPLLALAKLAQGDLKKSMAFLMGAVQADPESAEAHYRLAMAYRQLGDGEKAAGHMARYKALKR